MPKRRRRLPGRYKPRTEPGSNFTGPKPLTLFQAPSGLWGVKDSEGNIVIEPIYRRAEQTEREKQTSSVRLVSEDTVLTVTPDDWDLLAFFSPD